MSSIALFTDIHLGILKDSSQQLGETIKTVESLAVCAKKAGVKRMFYLGDLFHRRTHLNVVTFNRGIDLIRDLANEFEIWFLLGNHDIYYTHTESINSLRFLTLAEHPHIHLVSTTTEYELDNKKFLLVPWLGNISQFSNKKYDVILGHLNITTDAIKQYFSAMHQNKDEYMSLINEYLIKNEEFDEQAIVAEQDSVNNNKFEIAKLFNLVNDNGVIFSGHFHMNDDFIRHGKRFIYIGSPLEHTWADIDSNKGFYIFDVNDNKISFVKNESAPKHMKIFYSQYKDKPDELVKFMTDNKRNYIKLIFDSDTTYIERANIFTLIQRHGNIDNIESDSNFEQNFQVQNVKPESLSMSKFDIILKFIETLPPEEFTRRKIDKEAALKMLRSYYAAITGQ